MWKFSWNIASSSLSAGASALINIPKPCATPAYSSPRSKISSKKCAEIRPSADLRAYILAKALLEPAPKKYARLILRLCKAASTLSSILTAFSLLTNALTIVVATFKASLVEALRLPNDK